jgi:predicted Zn-dependent peptidase
MGQSARFNATSGLQATFLEEEFKSEFGNVQEEMASRSNNHFRRLNLEMRQHFGLLAKTDSERLKLMKNVKVEDVRRHYKKTHITPNMRFIIAGNLNPARRQKIKEMIEAIDLPNAGERLELPEEIPHALPEPVYVHNSNVENIYFTIDAFIKRRLKNSEKDALDLLNLMLTGTLYSKILGTARERGLVYSMSSGCFYNRSATNWWFGAQVSEKNAPALFEIIISEIKKVANGDITDEEIEEAKQYALGRFQRSAQTVHGISTGYHFKYFFNDKVEDYYRVPARIKAVTKEQIVKITYQMLKSEIWGAGFLGNCGVKNARELN